MDKFEKIFQNWTKIILDLLEKNVADAIQHEDWKKFLITLNDGIGTGEFGIAMTKNDFETSEGKFLGFKSVKNDEEIFILSPIAIWSAVSKKTKIFSENRTDIFKELCERDIAIGYESKNAEGKIRRRYLKKIKFHYRDRKQFTWLTDAIRGNHEPLDDETLYRVINSWKCDEPVIISTQTGYGKNTFVSRVLVKKLFHESGYCKKNFNS